MDCRWPSRLRALNQRAVNPSGRYVLYWMTAARRAAYNHGLEHAAAWAERLGKPLLILEALRSDYPWASRRLHAFILQGMADNQAALAKTPARYYPYVEPAPGHGRGLLPALAAEACLVVSDWHPCFFFPRMLAAAAGRVEVRLEAVDSCGLLPLAAPGREFNRAYDFRRYLQKNLPAHLERLPLADPLAKLPDGPSIPRAVTQRWPLAGRAVLAAEPTALAGLPIDQRVAEAPAPGGRGAGLKALAGFLARGLARYHTDSRHPAAHAESGLSPYLHFGHLSPHEVFLAVAQAEEWAPYRLSPATSGKREGWWGMGPGAEAFLDQLVTWRELGFNFCEHRPDYDRYESLPGWARETLQEHAPDPRPYLYNFEELDQARTHDELWNAAQRQLLREGRMHNYLRMVWGKKILQWSRGPREALAVMIELNNRYSLDGRDPNSYSGIFWALGRFDRAWGPVRPVLGKVRYMSLAAARRKLKLGDYLERYAG